MSTLPALSTLASKPAQNPSTPPGDRPLPMRTPSSNNYTPALAEQQSRQAGQPGLDGSTEASDAPSHPSSAEKQASDAAAENIGSSDTGKEPVSSAETGGGAGTGPEDSSWRPNVNRTQSWNAQDFKRDRQERLMGEEAAGPGFSEKKIKVN